MATAALNTQPLHPETQQLLGLDKWTDDPTVNDLFGAIRGLDAINERLRVISSHRPGLCWQAAADVGRIAVERGERGRVNVVEHYLVPSGACAELWKAAKQLRDDWIDARLKAEGLRPDMSDYDRYADHRDVLEGEAVTVDAAWAAFQRGEG